jgi:hypothetical protein
MPSWGLFSLVLAVPVSVPAADFSAGSAINIWVDVGVVGAWKLESFDESVVEDDVVDVPVDVDVDVDVGIVIVVTAEMVPSVKTKVALLESQPV